ncbi:helix-turn-helix transcriptional regulator [Solwaraspora sp. WMMD406]|uniref:helix-turn-helix domain-containing protein n=1 Tax=Solwaraspora sp. WMMD406 TaxID=3016095 RepID=UPI0024165701|nr:helix-turn-helix transcriptional regulator [Solwaraspora sp. WMMD406]MDG4763329.1 helix-turn-helix transcriptional regulator [Solwaraspora sp. WMMD406]
MALRSPTGSGRVMSRQEVAEAVNAWVFERSGRRCFLNSRYIGQLERGETRWPSAHYRAGLRAVLGATNDAEIGLFIIYGAGRGSQTTASGQAAPASASMEPADEVGSGFTAAVPGSASTAQAHARRTWRPDATTNARREMGTRAPVAAVDSCGCDVAIGRWTGRESRALREALRMSVRAFAEYLGVSKNAVSWWENRDPTPLRLATQAVLDQALTLADSDTRIRFGLILAGDSDEFSGPRTSPAHNAASGSVVTPLHGRERTRTAS